MKTNMATFRFILFLLITTSNIVLSQPILPKPDHIVIVILENHGYEDIIDSPSAPYINSLATDTLSAFFTMSYGLTHPSQPNYLLLYSGSAQGVTGNEIPINSPFTTDNIGRQLIDSGKTFISYSEDMPVAGYNGEYINYYARKHNPVTNWMGNGINQVSPTINQPFTAFPSSNFELLPTVCFVIPSTFNDMHDGVEPTLIKTGDEWISKNMNSYIQWAKTHNSLIILTFDEDDYTDSNHITTIFSGQMIKTGQYSSKINHYSILHTIEKLYGLPYIGDSLSYAPITDCWKHINAPDSILTNHFIQHNASQITKNEPISNALIYPNPTNGFFYVELSDFQDAKAEIYHLNGECIQVNPLMSKKTELIIDNLMKGVYLLKIKNNEGIILRKLIKN
jgi:phosphatidylinositol-3-phosphatase